MRFVVGDCLAVYSAVRARREGVTVMPDFSSMGFAVDGAAGYGVDAAFAVGTSRMNVTV